MHNTHSEQEQSSCSSGGQPQEPLGALVEAAIGMHELFEAYCVAGFETQQALYLTGVLLAASNSKRQPPQAA